MVKGGGICGETIKTDRKLVFSCSFDDRIRRTAIPLRIHSRTFLECMGGMACGSGFIVCSVVSVRQETSMACSLQSYCRSVRYYLADGSISAAAGAVLCFAVFQTVFWALRRLQRQKQFSGSVVRSISVIMAVVVTVSFFGSVLLVHQNPDWFYQTASAAEGAVQRTMKRLSGDSLEPEAGMINRGNLYPAGILQLKLQTPLKPTETLYLKEFSGGTYADGVWQQADEEAIFERMGDNSLHWGRWTSLIPSMLDSLYYVINASVMRDEPLSQRILQISYEKTPSEEKGWAVPYYGMWPRWQRETAAQEYGVYYFQSDEMGIDWENTDPSLGESKEWYFQIQQAYLQELDSYTAVPSEELSRLTKLCEQNPKESLQEITAFIISVLGQASYTKTPGFIPVNQDPVEYFLFERGEGYCQHFASAAVLMYRLYGIPARYATGYAVSPDSFELGEDGSYTAVVTDESAHAWPEIFLEDYGWVPVEVTPSEDRLDVVYPGMDFTALQGMLEKVDLSLPDQPQETAQESLIEDRSSPSVFSLDPIGIVFCILMIMIFYWVYRQCVLCYLESCNSRQLFWRMMKALHDADLFKEYDGSEPDFPEILSETLELPGDLVQQSIDIVLQSAYGQENDSGNDQDLVRILYEKTIKALYIRLPWRKRVWLIFYND